MTNPTIFSIIFVSFPVFLFPFSISLGTGHPSLRTLGSSDVFYNIGSIYSDDEGFIGISSMDLQENSSSFSSLNPKMAFDFKGNCLEAYFLLSYSEKELGTTKRTLFDTKNSGILAVIKATKQEEEDKAIQKPDSVLIIHESEVILVKSTFEITENLSDTKLFFWISEELQGSIGLPANIFRMDVGALELLNETKRRIGKALASFQITCFIGLLFSTQVFPFAFQSYFSLISLLELPLLGLLNFERPASLDYFLQAFFKIISLEFLPNFLEKIETLSFRRILHIQDVPKDFFDDEAVIRVICNSINIPNNFRNYGFFPTLNRNIGYHFIILGVLAIPGLVWQKWKPRNDSSKLHLLLFQKRWGLPMSYIFSQFTLLFLSLFLQTRAAKSKDFLLGSLDDSLSFGLYFVLFFVLAFTLHFALFSQKPPQETTENSEVSSIQEPEQEAFFREFKSSRLSQRLSPFILMSSIVLESMAAALLYDYPETGLGFFLLVNIFTLSHFAIHRPFEKRMELVLIIWNKLGHIGIGVILPVYSFGLEGNSDAKGIVSLVSLALIFMIGTGNLIILVLGNVSGILRKIKEKERDLSLN